MAGGSGGDDVLCSTWSDRFPHLTEIIQTGRYIGFNHAPEHQGKYKIFHHFYKEVNVRHKGADVVQKAIVDVTELGNGKFAYHLNHEGSPSCNEK